MEGSSATVIANRIDLNTKANIAIGGAKSGNTIISYNLIEESKSEGIFIVEGEEGLNIKHNWIERNADGVVLVNSKGSI